LKGGKAGMRVQIDNYEIISDTKLKVYKHIDNIKKEFKKSLFIEIDGKIEEIPADGRWYTIKDHYVKVADLNNDK
jgi:hypothetical protein